MNYTRITLWAYGKMRYKFIENYINMQIFLVLLEKTSLQ